jgi:hypothetical protein
MLVGETSWTPSDMVASGRTRMAYSSTQGWILVHSGQLDFTMEKISADGTTITPPEGWFTGTSAEIAAAPDGSFMIASSGFGVALHPFAPDGEGDAPFEPSFTGWEARVVHDGTTWVAAWLEGTSVHTARGPAFEEQGIAFTDGAFGQILQLARLDSGSVIISSYGTSSSFWLRATRLSGGSATNPANAIDVPLWIESRFTFNQPVERGFAGLGSDALLFFPRQITTNNHQQTLHDFTFGACQ